MLDECQIKEMKEDAKSYLDILTPDCVYKAYKFICILIGVDTIEPSNKKGSSVIPELSVCIDYLEDHFEQKLDAAQYSICDHMHQFLNKYRKCEKLTKLSGINELE